MATLLSFINEHPTFTFLVAILNVILVSQLYGKIVLLLNKHVQEAILVKDRSKKYSEYKDKIKHIVKDFDSKERVKESYYNKVKLKLRRSGYRGDYAAVYYLLIKYVCSVIAFVIGFIVNFPSIAEPLTLSILIILMVEYVLWVRKRDLGDKLRVNIYRIYKYLNNQVSSGVKVDDSITNVYEVITDESLSTLLLRLGEYYNMTKDIDEALEDFKQNFSIPEADALCVAIKQGIDTGDNRNILQRQEETMFRKYLNYVQAETKSRQIIILISAIFLLGIVIAFIFIPMIGDIVGSFDKIFISE